MIASRDIQKGELILQELPLVTIYSKVGYLQWSQNNNATNFYNNERAGVHHRLSDAVALLGPVERAQFNALHIPSVAIMPLQQIVARFEYNAFELRMGTVLHIVVYRTIFYVNHSCVNNTNLDICEQPSNAPLSGQARLIATRTIPMGNQIIINYINECWLLDRTLRRAELQNHWGFACNCEGCIAPAAIGIHERASASAYRANLLAPTAMLSVTYRSTRIVRLISYIAPITSL
jgi:hypothetical protein